MTVTVPQNATLQLYSMRASAVHHHTDAILAVTRKRLEERVKSVSERLYDAYEKCRIARTNLLQNRLSLPNGTAEKSVEELEAEYDRITTKIERVEIVEHTLAAIEAQFPTTPPPALKSSSRCFSFDCFLACLDAIGPEEQERGHAVRHLRDVILNPASYKAETTPLLFPKLKVPTVVDLLLVESRGEIDGSELIKEKVLRTKKTAYCIDRLLLHDRGFGITIGTYRNDGGAEVETIHFIVQYKNGRYSILLVDTTYLERTPRPVEFVQKQKALSAALLKEIEFRKAHTTCEEVAAKLWATFIPKPNTRVGSLHQVYLVEESSAVFKSCSFLPEKIARTAAYLLLAPDAIVSSCSVTLEGYLGDNPRHRTHYGIVQPLLRPAFSTKMLLKKDSRFVQELDRLDLQTKLIVQAILGQSDLHSDNVLVISRSEKLYLEFIDHGLCLGFGRPSFKGAGNNFSHNVEFVNEACLPVRCCLLAVSAANEPLEPKTLQWLGAVEANRGAIERHLFHQTNTFVETLSEATKRLLQEEIQEKNLSRPETDKRTYLASSTIYTKDVPLRTFYALSARLRARIARELPRPLTMIQPRAFQHEKKEQLLWTALFLQWNWTREELAELQELQESLQWKHSHEDDLCYSYFEICSAFSKKVLGRQGALPLYNNLFCSLLQHAQQWDREIEKERGHDQTRKTALEFYEECLLPERPLSEERAFMERLDRSIQYAKGPAPTLLGLYETLFPYLRPVMNLLADIANIETSLHFGTDSIHATRLFLENLLDHQELPAPKLPLLEMVRTLDDLCIEYEILIDEACWPAQWNNGTPLLIDEFLDTALDYFSKGYCSDERKHSEYIQALKTSLAQLKNEALAASSDEFKLQTIKSCVFIIKQMSFKLKSIYIHDLLDLRPRETRQKDVEALQQDVKNRQTTIDSIYAEEVLFTIQGKLVPYSLVPISWVLEKALFYGLLPGNTENPLYKNIKAELYKMQ